MIMCFSRCLIFILFLLPTFLEAALKKSETQLLADIYHSHPYTLFCQQGFNADGKLTLPHCQTCPTEPLQVKWMPIVPLKRLASGLRCYQDKLCIDNKGKRFGGLRCCEKTSAEYRLMSHDLNNYVPENPHLVRMRSQYAFDDFLVPSPSSGCHFYLDRKHKRISVAPNIRGFIARITLYMYERYRLPFSQEELSLYRRWDKQYPATDWEKQRERNIRLLENDRTIYQNRYPPRL